MFVFCDKDDGTNQLNLTGLILNKESILFLVTFTYTTLLSNFLNICYNLLRR